MFYNPKRVEVIYDYRNDPIELPPRCLYGGFDGTSERYREILSQVDSPIPFLEKATSLLLIRRGALGDVLMLIPVVRQLLQVYPNIKKVILETASRISQSDILKEFCKDVFHEIRPYDGHRSENYDLAFYLGGLVEQDHYMAKCRNLPRITIYQSYFALPECGVTWTPEIPLLGSCKEVVFCSGGSTVVKQLSSLTAGDLARDKSLGVTIHVSELLKVPPLGLLEALRNAKVCITVDSAVLWMCHFTCTPVVFLSGPTRGAERLAHHPLRPDGVWEVSLSKEIGCEPCYESVRAGCTREHIRCMQGVPFPRLRELILEGVRRVAWKIK
jgi:hypothetical protein